MTVEDGHIDAQCPGQGPGLTSGKLIAILISRPTWISSHRPRDTANRGSSAKNLMQERLFGEQCRTGAQHQNWQSWGRHHVKSVQMAASAILAPQEQVVALEEASGLQENDDADLDLAENAGYSTTSHSFVSHVWSRFNISIIHRVLWALSQSMQTIDARIARRPAERSLMLCRFCVEPQITLNHRGTGLSIVSPWPQDDQPFAP